MKTEPANICAWCGNRGCAVSEGESQGRLDCMYPEITSCGDFFDYRDREVPRNEQEEKNEA